MEQNYKMNLKTVFSLLYRSFLFMEKDRKKYVAGTIFSFLEMAVVYIMPLLISGLLAYIQNGTGVKNLGVLFLAFFFAAPLVSLGKYWMGMASYQGICNLKKKIFAHMLSLPVREFDNTDTGKMLGYLSIDADKMGGMFRGYAITGLLKFVVYEGMGIFFLIWVDIRFLPIAIGFCLVSLFFTMLFNPKVRGLEAQGKHLVTKLMGYINQMINGLFIIRIFPMKDIVLDTYRQVNENVYQTKRKFRFVNGMGYAFVDLFSLFVQPVGLAVSLIFLAAGEVTASQAVLAANVMGIMGKGTKEFNAFWQYIQSGIVSAARVFDFLEKPIEKSKNVSEIRGNGNATEAIRFENVDFTYPGRVQTIKKFSWCVKTGMTVAVVGDSGSGKSTVMKLISGLYRVSSGKLKLFGMDPVECSDFEWEAWCSYVPQNPALIDGTILENLVMAAPETNIENIRRAVQMVELEKFFMSLPDGYDTKLGANGIKVSGGQKQRIAIARAVLREAPILLLDEATSALDAETEYKVLKNMNAILGERTVILSSHRLYTVKNADCILVMKNGAIEGYGTHEELIRNCAHYRELCESVMN